MNDVAAAAGVARATLYRYFPSRALLLDSLAEVAAADAAERLAASRVEEVPPQEALSRAIRALVDVGDPFVVLARERVRPDAELYERALAAPLRRVIERGQQDGVVRDDVASAWLTDSLVGLIVSVLASTPVLGREDTVATITSLYLDGARARPRRARSGA